jgi:hypothetical protein
MTLNSNTVLTSKKMEISEDCLSGIFLYLTMEDIIENIMLVSKKWKNVLEEKYIWEQIINDYKFFTVKELNARMTCLLVNEILNSQKEFVFQNEIIISLLKDFENNKHFKLKVCSLERKEEKSLNFSFILIGKSAVILRVDGEIIQEIRYGSDVDYDESDIEEYYDGRQYEYRAIDNSAKFEMRLDFCLLSGKKDNSSEVLHDVSKLGALECQPSKVLGCIKKIISSILKSTKFKSNDIMTKIEEYFKSDSKESKKRKRDGLKYLKGLTFSSLGRLWFDTNSIKEMIEERGGEYNRNLQVCDFLISSNECSHQKTFKEAIKLNIPIVTIDFILSENTDNSLYIFNPSIKTLNIMEEDKSHVSFNYKNSVNDEWEQKKKLYGFTDDIKNTKLYQLNCETEDGAMDDFSFNYKNSVNDEWEQKKKLYGFTDDIKNTKLYQLN